MIGLLLMDSTPRNSSSKYSKAGSIADLKSTDPSCAKIHNFRKFGAKLPQLTVDLQFANPLNRKKSAFWGFTSVRIYVHFFHTRNYVIIQYGVK